LRKLKIKAFSPAFFDQSQPKSRANQKKSLHFSPLYFLVILLFVGLDEISNICKDTPELWEGRQKRYISDGER